jgi:hypothetical protein
MKKAVDDLGIKSINMKILFLFFFLFMFVSPFYKGLFNGLQMAFNYPIYFTVFLSGFALIFLGFGLIRKWNFGENIHSVMIWSIPLTYVISAFYSSSGFYSINSILVYILYSTLFVSTSYLVQTKKGNSIVKWAIILSALIIVIHGFLNWFGILHYVNAVLDRRLSGIFQYPNSYAAFLMAILLACLIQLCYASRPVLIFFYGSLITPIVISILFTLSRGALLILPILFLIMLLFLSFSKQLLAIIVTVVSVIFSALTMGEISRIRGLIVEEFHWLDSIYGLFIVAIVSLITGIISIQVKKLADKTVGWNGFGKLANYTKYYIPVVLIGITSISLYVLLKTTLIINLLPANLKRIATINLQQTALSDRTNFFKDSYSLFKDYPFFGAGGGAWATLFEQYQSEPYISRQTHSFPMQILVEVGLVGAIIFFIFIFYLFFKAFRNRKNDNEISMYAIIVIAVLSHSLIDFHMSFVYLGGLIFICLGGMLPMQLNIELQKNNNSIGKYIYSAFILLLGLVIIIMGGRAVQAYRTYNSAFDNNANAVNINTLDRAISQQNYNAEYKIQRTGILLNAYQESQNKALLEQAQLSIEDLRESESHNRLLLEHEFFMNMITGNKEKALQVLIEKKEYFKWDIALYERIISLAFELRNNSSSNYRDTAEQFYEEVTKMEQAINERNMKNDKNFAVSNQIKLIGASLKYEQGNYSETIEVLEPILSELTNEYKIEAQKIYDLAQKNLKTKEK